MLFMRAARLSQDVFVVNSYLSHSSAADICKSMNKALAMAADATGLDWKARRMLGSAAYWLGETMQTTRPSGLCSTF